jgi:hypothetical protein
MGYVKFKIDRVNDLLSYTLKIMIDLEVLNYNKMILKQL